ncbi:MAG TPA: hypothetical protein VIH26_03485 [Anaerolineales bacterium]
MDSEAAIDSPQGMALARLRDNPRVSRIRVIVAHDACPACRQQEGEYEKAIVARLPATGCSHPLGCRCFYEPTLTELYP